MAMDVGGGKGGVKSDINVTPLVDVMLVLLIIMMLIAPLLQKQVDLTLPQAVNTSEKPDTSDQVVVYVDGQNRLYVNAIQVTQEDAIPHIEAALEDKAQKIVYLKGDKDASYSAIMKMMDALRGAKIDSVALITDKPAGSAPSAGGN